MLFFAGFTNREVNLQGNDYKAILKKGVATKPAVLGELGAHDLRFFWFQGNVVLQTRIQNKKK